MSFVSRRDARGERGQFGRQRRAGHAVGVSVSVAHAAQPRGGCVITGAEVVESLLFTNVRVNDRSYIEKSLVFPDVVIGHDCVIKNAIIDTGLIPNLTYQKTEINHVMSNSFGFGGNCASLIFSKL